MPKCTWANKAFYLRPLLAASGEAALFFAYSVFKRLLHTAKNPPLADFLLCIYKYALDFFFD